MYQRDCVEGMEGNTLTKGFSNRTVMFIGLDFDFARIASRFASTASPATASTPVPLCSEINGAAASGRMHAKERIRMSARRCTRRVPV